MAKVVDFTSFDHQGQDHSEVKVIQRSWHVQSLTQRKIECKYEVNPFTNKKVMAKVVDFTTFDHQGQGHSEDAGRKTQDNRAIAIPRHFLRKQPS